MKKLILIGKLVEVCSLDIMNLDSYLSVYRDASAFAVAYDAMPELWMSVEKEIRESFLQKEDNRLRCLVRERNLTDIIGYINATFDSIEEPEIDIAIVEEQRGRGYGFEASQLLIKHLLNESCIKCVIWSAFLSNGASRRIAEKLGGKPMDERNLIKEAMHSAGVDLKSLDGKEIPRTISYRIS